MASHLRTDSPAGRTPVHSPLRQRSRIEQCLELRLRQSGRLQRHVEDRPAFLVGLLRRRRPLFIADYGIQCRDEDRILVERLLDVVLANLEAGDRASPDAR